MAREGVGVKGGGLLYPPMKTFEAFVGGDWDTTSVATSVTEIPTTILSGRKFIWIQNLGTTGTYVGIPTPDLYTYYPGFERTIYGNIKSLKWTASSGGSNEYYATTQEGGDPGLTECKRMYGVLSDGGAETLLTNGAVASLADHAWDWGDGDSLGYSTIYFADATADPDASTWMVLYGYTKMPDTSSNYGLYLGEHDYVYGTIDGSARIFALAVTSANNVVCQQVK